jgi:hypothetical protein
MNTRCSQPQAEEACPVLPEEDGAVQRAAQEVHCSTWDKAAVISIVSRSGPRGPICYVQWCSLRALDKCDEHCLRGWRGV